MSSFDTVSTVSNTNTYSSTMSYGTTAFVGSFQPYTQVPIATTFAPFGTTYTIDSNIQYITTSVGSTYSYTQELQKEIDDSFIAKCKEATREQDMEFKKILRGKERMLEL